MPDPAVVDDELGAILEVVVPLAVAVDVGVALFVVVVSVVEAVPGMHW